MSLVADKTPPAVLFSRVRGHGSKTARMPLQAAGKRLSRSRLSPDPVPITAAAKNLIRPSVGAPS
jgi:hypothetical protein